MARVCRVLTPSVLSSEVPLHLQLWMLRILIPLNGHRNFVSSYGFASDAIATALGFGDWIDSEKEFDAKEVRQKLRQLHRQAESASKSRSCDALTKNLKTLAQLVRLTKTDCRILEFAVQIHNERILDDVADYLGDLSSAKVFHALSVILDLPEPDVRQALSADSTLSRCALVSVDRNGSRLLRAKLDLLSEKFADYIVTPDTDPVRLIRDMVHLSSPGHLGFADFVHIKQHLAIMRPFLHKALMSRRLGVNVLLYGPPGTGKNQLAKALASDIGCQLFEVASEDGEGDSVSGEQRLRAYRAAQHFFASRATLLLFDEVEDVFSAGGPSSPPGIGQSRKAWMNRMLEQNPVPTLWLSNSIQGLDPAFIRRFDLVVELPVPPKQQREQIALQAGGGLLSALAAARMARCEHVTPAVIARAASVVTLIQDQLSPNEIGPAIETLVSNTLEAQGFASLLAGNDLAETYDPVFINADVDLTEIARGLTRTKSGRICLYGPPGTGKSAYAIWLAQQLGKPLITKRASELFSKWTGGTERLIARAFQEAAQQEAVLLIDEVDSFLRDRRGAHHAWEVSHVNEMLTQMESFTGLFIASTNLMVGLDQASLRRFDLKVKFDYLKPEQAWQLLCRYCKSLALPAPGATLKTRLSALCVLTPGDFAAIARQAQFNQISSAEDWISALERECALKENGRKVPMGFIG